jgi:hypothetical protein
MIIVIGPDYVPLAPADISGSVEALREWALPIFQEGLQHPHTVEATLLRGLLMLADPYPPPKG